MNIKIYKRQHMIEISISVQNGGLEHAWVGRTVNLRLHDGESHLPL